MAVAADSTWQNTYGRVEVRRHGLGTRFGNGHGRDCHSGASTGRHSHRGGGGRRRIELVLEEGPVLGQPRIGPGPSRTSLLPQD